MGIVWTLLENISSAISNLGQISSYMRYNDDALLVNWKLPVKIKQHYLKKLYFLSLYLNFYFFDWQYTFLNSYSKTKYFSEYFDTFQSWYGRIVYEL